MRPLQAASRAPNQQGSQARPDRSTCTLPGNLPRVRCGVGPKSMTVGCARGCRNVAQTAVIPDHHAGGCERLGRFAQAQSVDEQLHVGREAQPAALRVDEIVRRAEHRDVVEAFSELGIAGPAFRTHLAGLAAGQQHQRA
jgi:hypothetical protein